MFVVTVVVIWEEPWFKDYGIGLSELIWILFLLRPHESVMAQE